MLIDAFDKSVFQSRWIILIFQIRIIESAQSLRIIQLIMRLIVLKHIKHDQIDYTLLPSEGNTGIQHFN